MASIAWNSITFSLSEQEFMPNPSNQAKIEMQRPPTPFWEAAWQSLLFKWLDNNYGVYVFIFLILLDWCSISLGLALCLWNRITHSTVKKNAVFFFFQYVNKFACSQSPMNFKQKPFTQCLQRLITSNAITITLFSCFGYRISLDHISLDMYYVHSRFTELSALNAKSKIWFPNFSSYLSFI